MNIPTSIHYALRILIDLAMFTAEKPCTVAQIAKRQAIPRQYLHQILLALKSNGMVKSTRGTHGGYMLALSPSQISVAAVVRGTHGDLLSQSIDAHKSVAGSVVAELWTSLCRGLNEKLESLNIQDLCIRVSEKRETNDYVI